MLRKFLFALAITPGLASAQPASQPVQNEDPDLAELDQAIAADAAAREPPAQGDAGTSLTNPDIAVIADFALAHFSREENLQTGGHDPTRTGFNLQALELAIGSAVDPYFRFDGYLVFGAEGFELEEAYATTLALPARLQARIGQFFTRFGRHNRTHPHAWQFVDQPFQLGRALGADGNRNLGAELSILLPLPWFVELTGSLTEAHGETARSFLDETERPVESPLDLQATVRLEQFFELSADLSLLAGASLASGPNGTAEDKRTMLYGADLYLKYRPITEASDTEVALQGEWLHRRRQVPGGTLRDHGGYAFVTWRFARRWQAGARYEYGAPARDGDGATGLDDLDPEWTAGRHRATGQLTFRPSEFSRLRAQLSLDRPRWLPDPIVATFLSCEFVIGAHGAHAF